MGKVRVLRGRMREYGLDGALNIIQDDQRFNHGFIVKAFRISYYDPGDTNAGSRDCYGVLATHEDAFDSPVVSGRIAWLWDDRRQIAWASTNHIGDSNIEALESLIDPTHVVVRDLWVAISAQNATAATYWNYYVELEQIDLNDNQAVMAIVQEEAQDVN